MRTKNFFYEKTFSPHGFEFRTFFSREATRRENKTFESKKCFNSISILSRAVQIVNFVSTQLSRDG
jgi:hypothetical protein